MLIGKKRSMVRSMSRVRQQEWVSSKEERWQVSLGGNRTEHGLPSTHWRSFVRWKGSKDAQVKLKHILASEFMI